MVKNRISSEIWCRQQSSWYIIIVSFSQCGQCKKFSNIYRTSLTCLLTIKRSGCNTSPKFEMAFKWPLFLYIEFLLSTLFDESSNSSIYCVAHLFYCGVFFVFDDFGVKLIGGQVQSNSFSDLLACSHIIVYWLYIN